MALESVLPELQWSYSSPASSHRDTSSQWDGVSPFYCFSATDKKRWKPQELSIFLIPDVYHCIHVELSCHVALPAEQTAPPNSSLKDDHVLSEGTDSPIKIKQFLYDFVPAAVQMKIQWILKTSWSSAFSACLGHSENL